MSHDPGKSQWQTQNGWLTTNRAAFLDVNLPQRRARLSVYELPTGQAAPGSAHLRTMNVSPEADVEREWLGYFSGRPESGMCLNIVNIGTLKLVYRECGSHGEILGDLSIDGDFAVFSRLVNYQSQTRRCKTLSIVNIATGKHDMESEYAIASHARCHAWDGAAVGTAIAWDEAEPRQPALGRQYIRLPSGAIRPLGKHTDNDSMVACGGYLFWQEPGNAPASTDVMLWTSGDSGRPILSPGEGKVPTSLQCTENRWLTTRVDDIDGKNEHLKLLVLDTDTLAR